MQLHGTARHCRLLCLSLRALQSCATLAPSPPHSRRVMAEHRVQKAPPRTPPHKVIPPRAQELGVKSAELARRRSSWSSED
eukprot:scaffold39434_cov47-Phaeocystis_antarctica.AAC.1